MLCLFNAGFLYLLFEFCVLYKTERGKHKTPFGITHYMFVMTVFESGTKRLLKKKGKDETVQPSYNLHAPRICFSHLFH